MSQDNTQIHDVVRERYGSIAVNNTSCCDSTCDSSGCCSTNGLYEANLLEGIPAEAVNLSLGCGDPVTIAGLKPGETVLDLGSGGGIDCFMAARQVGESGYVIGVDMTPEMLEKANANKSKINATNVEFRQGYIEALPVDDNTIDVIMSNCVINLSPDKSAVFSEAFRVLKPGGRLSISDIVTEGTFSDELRANADQWAACVTGAIEADTYTGLMRAAGFVDIQIVDKADAESLIPRQPGMPRIFSARITGRKPEDKHS